MTIKIAGVTFDKYESAKVDLIFDSVASTFSFLVYFDPSDSAMRAALQPGTYPDVVISHNNETLITGTLLSYAFKSSAAPRHLVAISGYSKTGVLNDCQLPDSMVIQFNQNTFKEICQKVCNAFNLTLVIDPAVADACDGVLDTTNFNKSETAAAFLSDLAGQINVILSHTPAGELYVTSGQSKNTVQSVETILANYTSVPRTYQMVPVSATVSGTVSTAVPVMAKANYVNGMPNVAFEVTFDGQRMHSDITVVGQQDTMDNNATSTSEPLENPYVGKSETIALKDQNDINNAQIYGVNRTVPRPRVVIQTSGSNMTIDRAQRNVLTDELKGIILSIEQRGWLVGGAIIRPGDIITVTNPDLHIYSSTRFFIQSARYSGNAVKETVELNCVVPETFNNDTPKNIFA